MKNGKCLHWYGFARKVLIDLISLCRLCVLCVSVVIFPAIHLTTEAQRTQRVHREEGSSYFSCKAGSWSFARRVMLFVSGSLLQRSKMLRWSLHGEPPRKLNRYRYRELLLGY